jgi:hypothetical protein
MPMQMQHTSHATRARSSAAIEQESRAHSTGLETPPLPGQAAMRSPVACQLILPPGKESYINMGPNFSRLRNGKISPHTDQISKKECRPARVPSGRGLDLRGREDWDND